MTEGARVGVLEYFGSKFYEPLPQIKAPALGQIVWTPVPSLMQHPWVIEGQRSVDTSHAVARAKWSSMTDSHFRRRDFKDLPILYFNLGETEELIAQKAKLRPGVVVGLNATVLGGLKNAPPHHEENRLVVAPVYDLASDDDPKGFSRVMAQRVRHLLYKQYFPIGEWRESRSPKDVPDCCSLRAGILRFDRLQFVTPSRPGCRLVPLKVADDVVALMHNMLWAYLHGTMSEPAAELRSMLIEMMPKDETSPT